MGGLNEEAAVASFVWQAFLANTMSTRMGGAVLRCVHPRANVANYWDLDEWLRGGMTQQAWHPFLRCSTERLLGANRWEEGEGRVCVQAEAAWQGAAQGPGQRRLALVAVTRCERQL